MTVFESSSPHLYLHPLPIPLILFLSLLFAPNVSALPLFSGFLGHLLPSSTPRCVFLPDNGAFFVNYVITAAFIGTGMELMRLGSLFLYTIRLVFSRSEPERVNIRMVRARPFPDTAFGASLGWVLEWGVPVRSVEQPEVGRPGGRKGPGASPTPALEGRLPCWTRSCRSSQAKQTDKITQQRRHLFCVQCKIRQTTPKTEHRVNLDYVEKLHK